MCMLQKILIVEDEPSLLTMEKTMLQMEDYVVEGTRDGRTVYEEIAFFQPDLIIMDVLLNGEDGRKICRTIKTNPESAHIPVLLMSGYAETEESAMESGADAFLVKPYEVYAFIELVNSFFPEEHHRAYTAM